MYSQFMMHGQKNIKWSIICFRSISTELPAIRSLWKYLWAYPRIRIRARFYMWFPLWLSGYRNLSDCRSKGVKHHAALLHGKMNDPFRGCAKENRWTLH